MEVLENLTLELIHDGLLKFLLCNRICIMCLNTSRAFKKMWEKGGGSGLLVLLGGVCGRFYDVWRFKGCLLYGFGLWWPYGRNERLILLIGRGVGRGQLSLLVGDRALSFRGFSFFRIWRWDFLDWFWVLD